MLKHYVTFTALLITITSLHAETISYSGYTLNTEKNIVTGGGLEWLQWDETLSLGVSTALSIYGEDKWRVASHSDMNNLFNAFNFGRSFDSDENTMQSASVAPDPSEDLARNHFISLFGDTYHASGNIYNNDAIDPYQHSIAYFGLDDDGDGHINRAMVFDDYYHINGFFSGGYAELDQDRWYYGVGDSAGIALVRDIAAVPVPPSIYLFLSGIFSMLGLRARHLSRKYL